MKEENKQAAWTEMKKMSHKRQRDGGECRDGECCCREKVGQRLFYSERLEAHLNSGCVSPALAECYLL